MEKLQIGGLRGILKMDYMWYMKLLFKIDPEAKINWYYIQILNCKNIVSNLREIDDDRL